VAHALHARLNFVAELGNALASRPHLDQSLDLRPLPKNLADWLARLRLLKGVPFAYLVPDEGLLPPESLRFFHLDMTWVDAMLDGALSIGRSLSTDAAAPLATLEAAAAAHTAAPVAAAVPRIRARHLGLEPATVSLQVVTGFLLRSAVVSRYAGLGVNVFPKGHTPADHNRDPAIEIKLLDILRFETLGEESDTLLCLVDGDAYRVDLHEAPEGLHYGIDAFDDEGGTVKASKNLHTFTRVGNEITLSGATTKLTLDTTFRPGGTRVLKMTDLGSQIAAANNITAVDAAIMGFEMTQGVGMVSFIKGQ
jgi:hypothetical protein